MMPEFIGEKIEVERGDMSPTPVSFTWRGETYQVAEVLEEWVDTGYGTAREKSRKWFTRRHRRYYVVRCTTGEAFEMYFDYADRRKPQWQLVEKR